MKCDWQWAVPHRPDPGRRARFSSLAPVLALIVGALGLFVAAPASAQDAPSVPRNVQVTPGDGKLTLTWQAPSSWGLRLIAGFYCPMEALLLPRQRLGGSVGLNAFNY